MPLYECRCARCELTFEVLAPLSASRMKSRRCPECGRQARRVISAVSFSLGSGGDARPEREASNPSRPDVTKLRVPPSARLCWMDDRSAARDEAGKKRGEPAPAPNAHGHDHSPLSDPVVFAHRREAAARKAKVAESKDVRRPRNPA